MIIDVQFESTDTEFDCDFGEVTNISDGGYERGLVEGEKVGYEKGSAEGYAQGEADGRKNEYDEFWDNYQNYGNRTDYQRAFSGVGWTAKNFKPKYDIAPTGQGAQGLFYLAFNNESEPLDLATLLEENGVVLDLSNTTYAAAAFQGNGLKRLPVIDASKKLKEMREVFRLVYKLEVIDGLILQADGSNTWLIAFDGTRALREITKIEGVIGNDISIPSPQLNKLTLTNLINALSETTSNKSLSISRTAINREFETAEGLADGSTSAEWLALVATKPNWTISLS